jgi:hypothetical protein
MLDFPSIMHNLSQTRPVFHNEADFQHALAWELHLAYPEARLRLEVRPIPAERMYVDIWCSVVGASTAIELKYATRRLSASVANEQFALTDQAARDLTRYDFIKDLTRLERIVEALPATAAKAIILTNDPRFWTGPGSKITIDTEFAIHEGRILEGSLAWAQHAGQGTTVGRAMPHALHGSYELHWHDYSMVPGSLGHFRYLMIEVPARSAAPGPVQV